MAEGREDSGLAATVAGELRSAVARLNADHRHVLELRDRQGLDHGRIGERIGSDPEAVALLLAEARMNLRAELRGTPITAGPCPDRERTLRTATRRQDGESVSAEDEDWLFAHLSDCRDCARAHAVLLEGAASYRNRRT